MQKIIISNSEKFNQIKSQIIKWWFDNLHVVSDFDRTLTKAFLDNWDFVASLISILRDENYLNDWYSKKAKDLFEYYHKIELDISMNIDKKKKYMEQWWTKHSKLLISSGLNKKDIIKSSKSKRIIFREKISDVFQFLDNNKVPVVVLSASWLWDESIIETLKFHNLYYSNIDVISNIYYWDKTWNAIDYKIPHIHSFNKNENFIKDSFVYEKIKNRKNIILLWDSIGDSNMVDGFEYKNLLKIWFLNYDIDVNLKEYKKYYDVVITWDWNLDFVYELFKELKYF